MFPLPAKYRKVTTALGQELVLAAQSRFKDSHMSVVAAVPAKGLQPLSPGSSEELSLLLVQVHDTEMKHLWEKGN